MDNLELYMFLFRGRDDVFAVRWKSRKTGNSGYSPVCANRQREGCLLGKAKYPCHVCDKKKYSPLTPDVLLARHIQGTETIGVYPLMPDNTSWFLAIDFDDAGSFDESKKFLDVCQVQELPAYIERSRSGNGYHVWVFFANPVPASKSRAVGRALLREAGIIPDPSDATNSAFRTAKGFDRIFPNQDRLTGKGLGNLIALPLQKLAVMKGNTVFLDPDNRFEPFREQWEFLSTIRRVSEAELLAIPLMDGQPIQSPTNTPKCSNRLNQPLQSHTDADSSATLDWITSQCIFIAYCRDNANALSEPAWFSLCSNLAPFGAKGRELFHSLSREYPNYTFEETEDKFNRAAEDPKPVSCELIKREIWDCGKTCGVKSPAGLRAKTKLTIDQTKNTIHFIRAKQGKEDVRRPHEINLEVFNILTEDMTSRGIFYKSGSHVFYFFSETNRLIEVSSDDSEFSLLLSRYGLVSTEAIWKEQARRLYTYGIENGIDSKVYTISHFDNTTMVLYIYDFGTHIYRVSPNAVEKVVNGTDGVLFLFSKNNQPFVYNSLLNSVEFLLDKHIFNIINFVDDGISPAEARTILKYWLYSIFFNDLLKTKPLMTLLGLKGSGKSDTLRMIGKLILGDRFDVSPMPSDQKDFEAKITNSPLVILDNLDSHAKWLNDILAIAATGGTIHRRQLFTTNGLVEFPIRATIAITSRTPKFTRDDVADRLLLLKLDRISSFIPTSELESNITMNRDALMSELINNLQVVVRALAEGKDVQVYGNFRMADFFAFCIKIAKHQGREEEVRRIFEKMSTAQSLFTVEDDPVYQLLCEWIQMPQNIGREIENKRICSELSDLASQKCLYFPFKDKPQAFAQRMFPLRSNLEAFFDIDTRKAHGNRTLYSFKPKIEEQ